MMNPSQFDHQNVADSGTKDFAPGFMEASMPSATGEMMIDHQMIPAPASAPHFDNQGPAVLEHEVKKPAKRPTAFTTECVLSPELAAFLGKDRMTRSEVVSSMWKTIRERGLIDRNQKQFAVCDEQLLKVIGKKRFKVFGMMKYLKGHIRDPNKNIPFTPVEIQQPLRP